MTINALLGRFVVRRISGPMTPADRARLSSLLAALVAEYTTSACDDERSRIVDCAAVIREHLREAP